MYLIKIYILSLSHLQVGESFTSIQNNGLNNNPSMVDNSVIVDGDFCLDTPSQHKATQGNPYDRKHWNCDDQKESRPYQFMNFMDYSNDECMFLFTPQQQDRMRQVIIAYKSDYLRHPRYGHLITLNELILLHNNDGFGGVQLNNIDDEARTIIYNNYDNNNNNNNNNDNNNNNRMSNATINNRKNFKAPSYKDIFPPLKPITWQWSWWTWVKSFINNSN